MLKRHTTFVIGAGASFDLGFPLGDKLRDQIIEILAIGDPNRSVNFADTTLRRIMQERAMQEAGTSSWPGRMEGYLQAAATIRAGLPFARSIDTFLDGLRDQPDVEFLGKLAIALVILRAEADSPLALRRVQAANAQAIWDEQLKRLLASWHSELSQILYDGHTLETLEAVFEQASFIVFNYDRCIEEFLTVSLMRRFNITRDRALGLVSRCRIVHPYGQVGSFFPHDQQQHIAFGQVDYYQLAPISSRIRTFTEAMEDVTSELIKDLVAQADVIVFMGFGWLPQNMELLQAVGRVTNAQRVFATTMNMAAGEVAIVADQIDAILRRAGYAPDYAAEKWPRAEFINEHGDCKALMTNCWLRLTSR